MARRESGEDARAAKSNMALAERLADASRAIVTGYFRRPIEVSSKADQSPVTVADRAAEAAIREILAEQRPDHGIIGEEHGASQSDAEFVWVVDPIDGTRAFITGKPLFGTLIGLLREGRPILGVIDMPALGERFVGAAGRPSLFRDSAGAEREIRTRTCSNVADAALTATTPHMFDADEFSRFEAVRKAARMTVYGNDCYAFGVLAMGLIDLLIEADLGLYDYLPQVPIIEGAGGLITDWAGEPVGLGSGSQVLVAGDARAHAEALALLAGT